MTRKETHVVPNSDRGGWDVEEKDAERASRHFDTKAEAERWGREHSKREHSEFIVHNKDGKISQADSHGHDPDPPRDKD